MGLNIGTWICLRNPTGEVSGIGEGPFIARNYALYGLMSSDFSEQRTLFETRGVPKGASYSLLLEMDLAGRDVNPDAFAQSWLTTSELEEVAAVYLAEFAQAREPMGMLDPGFAATLGAMRALDDWCQQRGEGWQALLVFDFD